MSIMNVLAYQQAMYDQTYLQNQQVPHYGQSFQDYQMMTYNRHMVHPSPLGQLAMESQHFQDRNETKPRLAKQEVEMLERHFQENHKPPSSLKRQLAEQMGVDVARINNWFQNRRAKAKHEIKQLQYSLREKSSQSCSEPESPDSYDFGAIFDEDQNKASESEASSSSTVSGAPPPPAASCNPHYEDPAAASIDSLQRTLRVATEAAIQRGEISREFSEQSSESQFGGPLYNDMSNADHAQFPISSSKNNAFEYEGNVYTTTEYTMDTLNSQSMSLPAADPQEFEPHPQNQDKTNENVVLTFPSQLLSEAQTQNGFSSGTYQMPSVDEPIQSAEEPSMRFMSPPPSAGIASRRGIRRPAPIGTSATRDVSQGPRTAGSQTSRRHNRSPSGMRSASIAGLNVLGSRIQKSIAVPTHSPLRQQFGQDVKKILNNIGRVQSPAAFNGMQNFAPPTPSSPRDPSHFQSQENDVISEHSEQEADPSMFQGYFFGLSPPETPGHRGGQHWGFDVTDEILHTPGLGGFPTDPLQVAHPQYVTQQVSQPVTPGFPNLPGADCFQLQMPSQMFVPAPGSGLPASPGFAYFNGVSYANNSPQYDFGVEKPVQEYHFPDGQQQYAPLSSTHSSPMQYKQQTFVFHNATVGDFEDKALSTP